MTDTPLSHVRAGRFVSALQERVIGTHTAATDHHWFVFFLDSGHAVAQSLGVDYEMSGPALHWGPLEEDTRLRIGAGSSGYYLFFNHSILDDAIGDVSEAAELRLFSSQHLFASFGRNDEIAQRIEGDFDRILHEAATPAFGSELAISAYVRLMLVFLRRSVDKDPIHVDTARRSTSDISRFRSLVEAHFRARWTVRQYSKELGMSYDRLHDVCIRAVRKPPARLLRERTLREAQVLLRRTSMSIESISAILGFTSASQFNHFFKSMADQTPGRYRKQHADQAGTGEETELSFADWP